MTIIFVILSLAPAGCPVNRILSSAREIKFQTFYIFLSCIRRKNPGFGKQKDSNRIFTFIHIDGEKPDTAA